MMAASTPAVPGKGKRTKWGRYSSDITLEEIESCFNLPSEEACQKLGVGLTILKRLCRGFGISRWPYRKNGLPMSAKAARTSSAQQAAAGSSSKKQAASPTASRTAGRSRAAARAPAAEEAQEEEEEEEMEMEPEAGAHTRADSDGSAGGSAISSHSQAPWQGQGQGQGGSSGCSPQRRPPSGRQRVRWAPYPDTDGDSRRRQQQQQQQQQQQGSLASSRTMADRLMGEVPLPHGASRQPTRFDDVKPHSMQATHALLAALSPAPGAAPQPQQAQQQHHEEEEGAAGHWDSMASSVATLDSNLFLQGVRAAAQQLNSEPNDGGRGRRRADALSPPSSTSTMQQCSRPREGGTSNNSGYSLRDIFSTTATNPGNPAPLSLNDIIGSLPPLVKEVAAACFEVEDEESEQECMLAPAPTLETATSLERELETVEAEAHADNLQPSAGHNGLAAAEEWAAPSGVPTLKHTMSGSEQQQGYRGINTSAWVPSQQLASLASPFERPPQRQGSGGHQLEPPRVLGRWQSAPSTLCAGEDTTAAEPSVPLLQTVAPPSLHRCQSLQREQTGGLVSYLGVNELSNMMTQWERGELLAPPLPAAPEAADTGCDQLLGSGRSGSLPPCNPPSPAGPPPSVSRYDELGPGDCGLPSLQGLVGLGMGLGQLLPCSTYTPRLPPLVAGLETLAPLHDVMDL